MTRILIADDDPVALEQAAAAAVAAGFMPLTAASGRGALDMLRADPAIAALVLDLVMPDLDGMAVLETMAREGLGTPVIVQAANAALETVTTALRNGAADVVTKPVTPERLMASLAGIRDRTRLEALLRAEGGRRQGTLTLADMTARAPAMERVRQLAERAARSTVPVLIEGEAGAGKRFLAQVIHGMSGSAGRPFVAVDCAGVPAQQLDALLFGSRRGAPGTGTDQPGKFAEAQGGTLYLAGVGELPATTQERLLRTIEQGTIEPLGAARAERVNVRLIAATGSRLLNLARTGLFREDLYYRLTVFPIYMPPLRERPGDVALLAAEIATREAARSGRRVAGLSQAALDLLGAYDWPGNVRQLEQAVCRAVLLAGGALLEPADFPQILAALSGRAEALKLTAALPAPSAPVHVDAAIPRRIEAEATEAPADRFLRPGGEVTALAEVERELIAFALAHYRGRLSRVARALGIGRSTLYRKLKEYGFDDGVEKVAA